MLRLTATQVKPKKVSPTVEVSERSRVSLAGRLGSDYNSAAAMRFPSIAFMETVLSWPCSIKGTVHMWLLVLVMLAPLADAEQIILKSFASYEECQPEGDRVGLELAESYPYEAFRILCAFRASPKVFVRHISK
jgi:hypothetical protein